jgi:hypothetical protein
VRTEAGDASYEDTKIGVDGEGAGHGQHACYQHPQNIGALDAQVSRQGG